MVSVIHGVSGNQRIMAIFAYPIMQTSIFTIFVISFIFSLDSFLGAIECPDRQTDGVLPRRASGRVLFRRISLGCSRYAWSVARLTGRGTMDNPSARTGDHVF